MARSFLLLLLSLLLLPLLAAAPARAQEAAGIWRVCVTDLALPPYLYNDPKQQGVVERILLDAGRQAGLSVLLLRYPVKRCRAMLDTQGLDAMLAAPTPNNLAQYQFPMKAGSVDPGRRLARINLVWVGRSDAPVEWNGQGLVGTRMGMAATIEPLQALGYKVDATSSTMPQLLQKVALKRVDLAVALQEEVEHFLRDPKLPPLVVLPQAFASWDFYAVMRKQLAPDTQEEVEAWWTAIGRLRDLPDYRPR